MVRPIPFADTSARANRTLLARRMLEERSWASLRPLASIDGEAPVTHTMMSNMESVLGPSGVARGGAPGPLAAWQAVPPSMLSGKALAFTTKADPGAPTKTAHWTSRVCAVLARNTGAQSESSHLFSPPRVACVSLSSCRRRRRPRVALSLSLASSALAQARVSLSRRRQSSGRSTCVAASGPRRAASGTRFETRDRHVFLSRSLSSILPFIEVVNWFCRPRSNCTRNN